ncbi:hypothetical protein LEP1GSC202_1749 [Leptospira yanagawae serovar Saopaulo str. Sao Paulo = ATCC 700523]|uniref:Uncharacterized protein n=1 Tax=Leptospira yanagawae serovar Saopaulo str. Sao Paulo = ATCC 700523 TaxID=1249483 RepID=A0A5E8HFB8_9LEPT|nr:hypothetical protein LEP1GSC202_1749 [Leptospira yanagawae serovar Saopaulo str. Sao Paulo = ATCC 700523]
MKVLFLKTVFSNRIFRFLILTNKYSKISIWIDFFFYEIFRSNRFERNSNDFGTERTVFRNFFSLDLSLEGFYEFKGRMFFIEMVNIGMKKILGMACPWNTTNTKKQSISNHEKELSNYVWKR